MKKWLLIFMLVPVLALAQDKLKCKGTTKENKPCKSTIVSKKTGYCRVHDPNALRCGVIKKDGKPCRNIVKNKVNGVPVACAVHSTEQ